MVTAKVSLLMSGRSLNSVALRKRCYALFAIALVIICIMFGKGTQPASPGLPLLHAAHWRTDQTARADLLYEGTFARVEIHQVKSPKGDGRVFKDWLWLDIQDQVNVLVHEKESNDFILFRQSKYGLENETLAIVGGLIEEGETPLEAAKRELLEELALESSHWVSLGRYRTDVNRGGGFINCFLALNSIPASEEAESDDLENQQILRVSKAELIQASQAAKFGEIKWAATVALSIPHLP